MQVLLGQAGAQFDVQSLDARRRSILSHAAISGSQTTLTALLQHCGDGIKPIMDLPDKDGLAPLHHACVCGYKASVQMLRENGAALCNPRSGPGLLSLACVSGNADMTTFILDECPALTSGLLLGASNPKVPQDCSGRYTIPIEHAPIVHAFLSGSKQVINLLLERGVLIDSQVCLLLATKWPPWWMQQTASKRSEHAAQSIKCASLCRT